MGPLRRDTLSSSDSFSARNSNGGNILGDLNLDSSLLFKSTRPVIQSATMDPPNVELTRTDPRLMITVQLRNPTQNLTLITQHCEAIPNS